MIYVIYIYGFNEDELKSETTMFNRMYKNTNIENNIISKMNFIKSGNHIVEFSTLAKLY